MWGFLKHFSTTRTQSPIETAFAQQSKSLVDTQKALLKIIEQQQSTLDRIVNAKYDTPVFKPQEIPAVQMPLWGMSDQDTGYIQPPTAVVNQVLSVIENGSDREFMEKVGG